MLTTDKGRSFRRRIAGASVLALATALVAGPARAQLSYNAGDPTVVSGNVTFNRGQISGVETYNVNTATAVLDFTPSDTTGTGNINFQNAGTSVTYQGASDFTVLNRIVPVQAGRAVQFNGAVNSKISAVTGGSVWFYSPGGIVLGGGAVFDVGSLLLATGDPTGGSGTIGSTSSFSIASASTSTVNIRPGAQIKASSEGSYIALVSPVVVQDGTVRVNGSAAYVAAEQATLTINQGLFDIDVVVGSDGGSGIIHQGVTGGPSSTGATGDNHGIYMVAVPKNNAISMFIAPTGDLGFDVATQASIENGAIYLQAGGDLKINPANPVESRIVSLPDSTKLASIVITGGNAAGSNILSKLVAQATGTAAIQSSVNRRLIGLREDAYLYSGRDVSITNESGQAFTADGRVIVHAIGPAAGRANILAQTNSSMIFQDSIDIFASPFVGRDFDAAFGVDQGGTAFLQANGVGASITAAGPVRVVARGVDPSAANDTVGGSARVFASNGGQITLSQGVLLDASASVLGLGRTAAGGSAILEVDAGTLAISGLSQITATADASNSANAVGGTARFLTNVQGGAITAQDVQILANGVSFSSSGGPGGSGKGGLAAFDLSSTSKSASVTVGNVTQRAEGFGGDAGTTASFAGGAGVGGTARTLILGGTTATVANMSTFASGNGGLGGPGGAGGDATGGAIQFNVNGGVFNGKNITLLAIASAGNGGVGPNVTTPGGNGGAALAGAGISIFADNGGSLTGQTTFLDATAAGGTGGAGFATTGLAGNGGAATAANTFVGTNNNGQISLAGLTLQSNAIGDGTGGGTAQAGGKGGDATGGNAGINANAGLIQVTSLSVRSNAFGGNGNALGANGGKATATVARADANNNGTLKVTGGSFDVSAQAFGGDASGVVGGPLVVAGEAVGGVADIFAGSGGTVDSAATGVFLDASGRGGAEQGNGNVTGATGRGGQARINANGGTIILRSEVEAIADGEGGDGGGTGNGGAGIGGEARLGTFGALGASKVQVDGDLFLDANGAGGGGGENGGVGGDGLGGTPPSVDTGPFNKGAYIVATGGEVTIGGTVIDMAASGQGGTGSGGGGAGIGGLTNFVSFGAAINAPGILNMDSSGNGGDGDSGTGSQGGKAAGGFALLLATSGGDSMGGGVIPPGTPTSITLGQAVLDASAEGGEGGSGAEGQVGGTGGDGVAGRVNALANAGSGTLKTDNLFIFLQGLGGDGGEGGEVPTSGGAGGAGGKGGAGTGGFTNFGTSSGIDTTENNGSATFVIANAFLNGIGGTGGVGAGSSAGGAGGLGTGGDGALLSRGSPVTLTTLSIDSSGFGGQGGISSGTGPVGANGGGAGGSAAFFVTNRFNRTERGSLTATDVSLLAGAFDFSGGTVGVGTAGQVFAQVTQSDVEIDTLSLVTFGATPPPTGSESGLLVDAGTLTVNNTLGISAIGDVQLGVVNGGVLNAASFTVNTTGSLLPSATGTPGLINIATDFVASFGGDFITPTNFDVGGSVNIDAGSQLKVGNVTAGQSVTLTSAGGLEVGDVAADDSIFLFAQGDILAGDLTAALSPALDGGGDIEIATLGSVTTGDIKAATIDFQVGDPIEPVAVVTTGSLLAETISLDVGGSLTTGTITTADIYAGIDTSFDNFLIGIGVAQDIKLGDVSAFTSIGVGSLLGSVTTGAITANDSVMLLGKTGVATAGVTTGNGPTDALFISNTSIIESNPDFAVLQDFDELGNDFDIAVLATATPVRVGGPVTLTGPVTTANFGAATTDSFSAANLAAGNRLLIDTGGDLTLGALSANVAINLTGGTVTFNGLVSAPQISVQSDDLQIGPSGGLGTSATTDLTLSTSGQLIFGGLSADGYVITGEEAQGLRAQRINIEAGSVTIRDATLTGSLAGSSANLVGDAGGLSIRAGSGVSVRGQLTVNNAASGNRLTLSAGEGNIDVVTDQGGGLAMFGASPSALGGVLELDASSVRAATASVLEQLGSSSSNRAQLLAAPPPGSPRPEGYLQANRIEFTINDELFIQNSNTASTFGGFSAGQGGALLRTQASPTSPVDAIIFGRIQDSSGSFKINQQAVGLLTLSGGEGSSGPATLSAASTFNNCPFTGSCGDQPPPPPPPPEEEEEVELIIDRIPAVIAAAVTSGLSSVSDPETVAALPTVTLVTTIDTAPIRTEPVISDPVTGGGNPSLWEGAADQDEREGRPTPSAGDGQ